MTNGRDVVSSLCARSSEVIFASSEHLTFTTGQHLADQNKSDVSKQEMKGPHPLSSCEDHQ
jgi:hypothetical protein